MGQLRHRRLFGFVLVGALCVAISWSGSPVSAEGDDGVVRAPTTPVRHRTFSGRPMAGAVRPNTAPHFYTSGLMTYHGGPVLHSSKVHAIFWDPGSVFTSDYEQRIVKYFTDVAHDSGLNTNVYSTVKEYTDTSGSAKYKVSQPKLCLGGACGKIILDSHAYASDCTIPGGFTACVSDTKVRGEVEFIRGAFGLPVNSNDVFFIFLPPGVDTCFSTFCYSAPAFCAYHSAFNNGSGELIYANMPFNPGYSGCTVNQQPQGAPADEEFNSLSHEHMEILTDPIPGTGWFNADLSHENGDQCAYTFDAADTFGFAVTAGTGSLRGTPGAFFNQKINRHKYLVQEEWSNKKFTASGNTVGCLQHK